MAVFVGFKEWQKIIGVIKRHDSGLSSTLVISADPREKILESIKKFRTKQPGILDYEALNNEDRNR